MVPWPNTGTQNTQDEDCSAIIVIGENGTQVARFLSPTGNDHIISVSGADNIDLLNVARSFNNISVSLINPKQPCFTDRGHDWWMQDKFLPVPKSILTCGRGNNVFSITEERNSG